MLVARINLQCVSWTIIDYLETAKQNCFWSTLWILTNNRKFKEKVRQNGLTHVLYYFIPWACALLLISLNPTMYTIEDVANQMSKLVTSYDLMIQRFGSRQQRYLRCVGNQVLNKLSRYACDNSTEFESSPKAAQGDTFGYITRHYMQSSERLTSFLAQYSHFSQVSKSMRKEKLEFEMKLWSCI